jgi:hypothetical protein
MMHEAAMKSDAFLVGEWIAKLEALLDIYAWCGCQPFFGQSQDDVIQ